MISHLNLEGGCLGAMSPQFGPCGHISFVGVVSGGLLRHIDVRITVILWLNDGCLFVLVSHPLNYLLGVHDCVLKTRNDELTFEILCFPVVGPPTRIGSKQNRSGTGTDKKYLMSLWSSCSGIIFNFNQ